MSIERGYVTLLKEDTGCTLNEYRVYSRLTRQGYKLFRHLAEVSVTRYEKEIHLDQHVLNCKRTYNSNLSTDISDNVEVNIADKSNEITVDVVNVECDVLNISNDVSTEDVESSRLNDSVHVLQDKESTNEIIQIERDESGNSCDVVSVASKAPASRSDAVPIQDDVCIDDDDDDDVVEIPISKEIVIVNDISSSDSEVEVRGSDEEPTTFSDEEEDEDDDDDDGSSAASQRSNSNWKRKSNESEHIIEVVESPPPPRYAVRTNYMTINEFLYDPPQTSETNALDHEVIELSDDENVTRQNNTLGSEIERFYKEIEVINIDSEPEEVNDDERIDIKKLTKKDILNSFPNLRNGVVTVIKVPPLSFLPPNVKPSRKEYSLTYTTSDVVGDVNNHNKNNHYSNNCNSHRYFSRNTAVNQWAQDNFHTRNRQYDGQRSYYRPSSYYNQNRQRFSSNANQWPAQPWQVNTIQNQVSQIREMATGMMQVASSLLSLPFVQQTFSNMPGLFGIGQSFQQARMPALIDSSQRFPNAFTDQQQYFGPRYSNFNNSPHMFSHSSLSNQSNNMITSYNSSVRQQFNSVPNNYNNSFNNYNNNLNSNLPQQNFNHRNNNNTFVQSSYNEHNISHPKHSPIKNFPRNENSFNSQRQLLPQLKNTDRASFHGGNQNNVVNHNDEIIENELRGGYNNAVNNQHVDSSVSQNENRLNENDSSHENGYRSGNSNGTNEWPKLNSRKRRKIRRQLTVVQGDCSVFTEDINITDAALALDSSVEKADFIPFGGTHNEGNLNNRRNRSNFNNRVSDPGGVDFVDNSSRRFDYRDQGCFNGNSNRGNRPWFNRNFRPNWRPYYNKRRRLDNETRSVFYNNPRSTSNEPVNISDERRDTSCESRDIINESRNTCSDDHIEIIEDVVGDEDIRHVINTERGKCYRTKRLKRLKQERRFQNIKKEMNERKSKRPPGRWRRSKISAVQRKWKKLLSKKDKNTPIEVIDIDIDDEVLSPIKKETNSDKQTSIKAETNIDQQLTQNNACSPNRRSVKREGLEDETSVNSIISGTRSCVSTNSTNSSCVIKSEPLIPSLKKETTVIKQETGSIGITTSVSSVMSSATETTVLTTTTSTVISVKVEENVAVKTEKSKDRDEDLSDVTTEKTSSVVNEPASIKLEDSNVVEQVDVKKEIDSRPIQENSDQFQSSVSMPIKTENVDVVSTDIRQDKEVDSIAENVANDGITAALPVSDIDKDVPPSTSVPENIEGEVSSWAQLKQSSTTVSGPIRSSTEDAEQVVCAESMDEDEDAGQRSDEEDDEGQIQPIVRAEDCTSISK